MNKKIAIVPKGWALVRTIVMLFLAIGVYELITYPAIQAYARSQNTQNLAITNGSLAEIRPTASGQYLRMLFAERHESWAQASEDLEPLLIVDPRNEDLLKRGLLLSMGAGDYERAFSFAQRLESGGHGNLMTSLFLAVKDFKNKDYTQAQARLAQTEKNPLNNFVLPLIKGWAGAAQGKNTDSLSGENSLHREHAALIRQFMRKASQPGVKGGPEITNANEGLSLAFQSLAQVFAEQASPDSARLFAHLALFLNPEMMEPNILLAQMSAQAGRFKEASDYFQKIPVGHKFYLEAQRSAAALLERDHQLDAAIDRLQSLAREHNDPESLIRIGDIHRGQENFTKALESYNAAAAQLGSKIPAEYWHLLYVRGISYERLGDWTRAEADLKAALEYRPDEPMVLNYLGYSWAEKGLHLQESLKLLERAAMLAPNDGAIMDSLGWVYYRLGAYDKALPLLEKAIALMPYDPVINDHLGDVYWCADRKVEARFQWLRAQNHTKDETLKASLQAKLQSGLAGVQPAQHIANAMDDKIRQPQVQASP
ncbi:MAG: tetratricopeptide repeat protein [Alphaproteobacteria bacterium]|nr:tetratricopeptide repeat protein [Alphaproteobacteria bacterium]